MGRKIFSALKRDWQLWVMILPALAYIIIFCYGPMYGIQLAFRRYDFSKGLTGGDWVGLKYFMQYFQSPMFGTTLRNTFVISFFSLLILFKIFSNIYFPFSLFKKHIDTPRLSLIPFLP